MLLTQQDVDGQQVLGFIESTRADGKRITGYEHAVLVTDLPYEVLTMAQLYRDRTDAENAFDELKNQGGLGWLHDTGSAPLSALSSRCCVDLQLVESVRASGAS